MSISHYYISFFLVCLIISLCHIQDVNALNNGVTDEEESSSTMATSSNSKKVGEKKKFRFRHKTVIIPHDEKKHRGGEDAAATSSNFLIVADGVGGWADHGVNPGLYSKLLVDTVLKLGEEEEENTTADKKEEEGFLMNIVDKANHYTASKHLGSATCTTLQLLDVAELESSEEGKKPPLLHTLNVGDSGYSIHRYNFSSKSFEVKFVSEVGQKRFNYPDQLGGRHGDAVRDVAVPYVHTTDDIIPSTDILVVFSDGASDNLYPHEYHECFQLVSQPSEEAPLVELVSLSWTADCIARKAYFLGKDPNFDSPFARGGRESGYYPDFTGGKHDDITVVVAQIVEEEEERQVEDPYFKDSITLYTDSVGKVEDMIPILKEIENIKQQQQQQTQNGPTSDDGKDEL